jgi:polyisoprenoid-binding protein YceI
VDKGPLKRAGFHATPTIDRRDFGIVWNGDLVGGGVVVRNDILITLDAEALLQD